MSVFGVVVAAVPLTGCSGISKSDHYNASLPSIMLMKMTTGCALADAVKAGVSDNIKAIIVIAGKGPFSPSLTNSLTVPMLHIVGDDDDANTLVKSISSSYSRGMIPTMYTSPSTDHRRTSWFSSSGPTLDGRIKPDIIAPGMMIGSVLADASSSCALPLSQQLMYSMGTSMATPVVAGNLLLLRQYLASGQHGYTLYLKNDSDIHRSDVLKALLVRLDDVEY